MKYTDLTNEELDALLEMSIAVYEGKISHTFFKQFMNLLTFAVVCRKASNA